MTRGWQACLQEKRHCPSWKLFLTAFVFRPLCPISNSIYPHIVQVDVVLQVFWTTSTVRCPITTAITLLVAAGLIPLPDTEHTSALQLSGSTPALRNDTIGEHSPLQHTLLGERSAICTKPKLQHPSDVWSLSWDALYCWVVTSPCTHPTRAVKQWVPKGRQHLGSYCWC